MGDPIPESRIPVVVKFMSGTTVFDHCLTITEMEAEVSLPFTKSTAFSAVTSVSPDTTPNRLCAFSPTFQRAT